MQKVSATSQESTDFINSNKTLPPTSNDGRTPGSRNHCLCKDQVDEEGGP